MQLRFVSRKKYDELRVKYYDALETVLRRKAECDAIRQDLYATRGSVECASRSTAELIERLNWNADRVLEFEKSMQFKK